MFVSGVVLSVAKNLGFQGRDPHRTGARRKCRSTQGITPTFVTSAGKSKSLRVSSKAFDLSPPRNAGFDFVAREVSIDDFVIELRAGFGLDSVRAWADK